MKACAAPDASVSDGSIGYVRSDSGEKARFEGTYGKSQTGKSEEEGARFGSGRYRRFRGELKAGIGEGRCDVDERCGFRVARAEAGASKGSQHLSRGLSAIEFEAAE